LEFAFLYRLTFVDRKNPPKRYQEISDSVREWFKSHGVRYGMGSLGGSRNIYGTVDGSSEQELAQIREQFAEWLSQLPVCASMRLGPTKRIEIVNLMDDDWERTFDINNLTEQDRREAHTYYTELSQWAEKHAKKPTEENH
jgi:hypothetical protein